MVDVMASPSEDFEDGELLEDGEICDDEAEETPTPKQGRIFTIFAEKSSDIPKSWRNLNNDYWILFVQLQIF